jgi:hypothetical protein
MNIMNNRKGKAMKIVSFALLLVSALAIALVGCSDKSDPIVSPPSDQALSPGSDASLGKCGRIVHSASANTRTRVNEMGMSDNSGQAVWCAKLDAWGLENGTCGGSIHSEITGPILSWGLRDVQGKVVQLRVVGNKAKFMFEVSKGHLADGTSLAGQVGCAVVIDNSGCRNTASADYWSAFAIDVPQVMKDYGFWEMSADDFINASTAAGFPPQPIGRGNIKVR